MFDEDRSECSESAGERMIHLRVAMTAYLAVLLSVCGLVMSGAASVGIVGLLVIGLVWFYFVAMVKERI